MSLRVVLRTFVCLALVAGLAGCQRYSMVPPQPVTVKSALVVTPNQAWNKINIENLGSRPTEIWTADGDQLNMLMLFAGVADGQSLFPSPDSEKDKYAPFKNGMTANEVVSLVEATLGRYMDSSLVESYDLRPANFIGQNGYRAEFNLVGKDEVDRRGLAMGAVKDGKLYLMLFTGTRLYHYGLRADEVERMMMTARTTP
jgi:hypothetical protein